MLFARCRRFGAAVLVLSALRLVCGEPACPAFQAEPPRPLPERAVPTLLDWNGPVADRYRAEEVSPPEFEPLATDRPDFTEASSTVGRGVSQLEVGYTLFHDTRGAAVRSHLHSTPEFLWRQGLGADWFELRVGWNYASEEFLDAQFSGAEDMYLGCKLWLTPQRGPWPELAVMPQMTVPTGHPQFTAGEVLPGVNWLYGWDIRDRWSLAGSTQFNRALDPGTDDAYIECAQSCTVGLTWTPRWKSYAEWFAFFPSGAAVQATEHYFNGGVTWLLTDDVQWDIRAGLGLNDAAADAFYGTGLSIRWR